MESGRNWYQIESKAGYIPKATKTYKRPSGRPEYFKNRFTKSLETSGFIQIDMSVFCVLFLNNEEHDLSLKNGFIFHDFQFHVLLLTSRARKLKL